MANNTDWMTVDVVREHVRQAANELARFEAASFEEFMASQLGPNEDQPPMFRLNFESPLEALFYVWWEAIVGRGFWGSKFLLNTQRELVIGTQAYRLDFVVALDPGESQQLERHGHHWPLIAVEVDGHTFHEKTVEQVAWRNQRDRALQQAGWVILHYSWTEMTTKPEECIGEVFSVARERYDELWKRFRAAERAADTKADAPTCQES